MSVAHRYCITVIIAFERFAPWCSWITPTFFGSLIWRCVHAYQRQPFLGIIYCLRFKDKKGQKSTVTRRRWTFGKQQDGEYFSVLFSSFLFIALNRLKTGQLWLLYMSIAVSVKLLPRKQKWSCIHLFLKSSTGTVHCSSLKN